MTVLIAFLYGDMAKKTATKYWLPPIATENGEMFTVGVIAKVSE